MPGTRGDDRGLRHARTPDRRLTPAQAPELLLLLVLVGVLTTLAIRWVQGPEHQRSDIAETVSDTPGTMRVPSTPTTVRARFSILTGTTAEVRVALDARYAGAHRPVGGSVVLSAATYVTRGRVQCVRTGSDAAVVGVTATTEERASGRRERRSGVLLLSGRPGSQASTFQLDLGRRRPDCSSARFVELVPIVGRFAVSR